MQDELVVSARSFAEARNNAIYAYDNPEVLNQKILKVILFVSCMREGGQARELPARWQGAKGISCAKHKKKVWSTCPKDCSKKCDWHEYSNIREAIQLWLEIAEEDARHEAESEVGTLAEVTV